MPNIEYIKWSYSKLKCYQDCKEKFYRKYILWEKEPPMNGVYFLEGNVLQNLFEHWFNYKFFKTGGRQWLHDNLKNYYIFHFHNPKQQCKLNQDQTHTKFMKSLTKMIDSCYTYFGSIGAFQDDVKVLSEVEYTVVTPDPRVQVTGKMDFKIEHPDGNIHIIDLKASTSDSKYIDKKQLVFYNYLLKAKLGKIANKSAFFAAKSQQEMLWEGTEKDLKALELELDLASKSIFSGLTREMAEDKNMCFRCAFKTDCWSKHGLIPTESEITF